VFVHHQFDWQSTQWLPHTNNQMIITCRIDCLRRWWRSYLLGQYCSNWCRKRICRSRCIKEVFIIRWRPVWVRQVKNIHHLYFQLLYESKFTY